MPTSPRKKTTKRDAKPKRYATKLSLHPMSFDEALGKLLSAKPAAKKPAKRPK